MCQLEDWFLPALNGCITVTCCNDLSTLENSCYLCLAHLCYMNGCVCGLRYHLYYILVFVSVWWFPGPFFLVSPGSFLCSHLDLLSAWCSVWSCTTSDFAVTKLRVVFSLEPTIYPSWLVGDSHHPLLDSIQFC